jgi:hypothetical protein
MTQLILKLNNKNWEIVPLKGQSPDFYLCEVTRFHITAHIDY